MIKLTVLRHRVYKAVQESICDWMINDVEVIAKARKKNARSLVNVITKNVIAKLKEIEKIKRNENEKKEN